MAAKQAPAGSGDDRSLAASINTNLPRFSLLSLFTNNQSPRTSFRNKRQKNSKKGQSKSKTKLESTSSGPSLVGTYSAAPADAVPVNSPAARTRLDSNTGERLRECPLCYDELPASSYPELILACGHASCASCMEVYLKIEIGESRIDVSCPECTEKLHPADIQQLLKSDAAFVSKYEQFMVRRVLVTDPDTRWCPAPDCGYAVIATGCAGCPMLQCQRPGCNTLFCYHCKQKWHANQTCDAARRERFPTDLRLSLSDIQSLARSVDEYKSCPRCKTMINKMDDGSCNHMTCSICAAQFCWLCLKEASDLHYLSPSGCTFWGKKPWSKKKKILWQLGTLVGAPVGIALLAGLSVPVLTFGLPIWAARKLYHKFKNSNKHRRNTIVTFGTIAAFIASPLVAGIVIAIGVPVLLAYVYGVVPYSLCRGGTCGVKNDGGILHFDFNSSNNDESAGTARSNDPFLVANPSIGPSIGENSLAAGYALSASGIQMDRVGLPDDQQSDTKSASMKNMAGTSITGSLYEPVDTTFQHQRLEIRADVSLRPAPSTERKNSIDSQTLSQADNRSLRSLGPSDNRSHVSFNVDNASVKALAGSICTPRDKDGLSIILASDLTAVDVKSKSCMRGDHGSPVSNRSVSFAAHDGKTKSKKKNSKRRRDGSGISIDKAEKLSLRSLDAVSTSSSNDMISVSKRNTEAKARVETPVLVDRPETETFAPADRPRLDSNTVVRNVDKSNGTPIHAANELTEIDVDKPQQYSTVVIKKTTSIANTGSSTVGGGSYNQLVEGKILCNILEDNV